MKIRIHDAAKDDLAEAYVFYESQQTGLGHRFLDHIFVAIDRLEFSAGSHPIYHEPYFQTYSQRFPFTIYYLIEEDEVRVDAVIDQRRKPEWIDELLETRSEFN